jgi:hypothetical protein
LKSLETTSKYAFGCIMSSMKRIGADEANAQMAKWWGYFNLNHEASTAYITKIFQMFAVIIHNHSHNIKNIDFLRSKNNMRHLLPL